MSGRYLSSSVLASLSDPPSVVIEFGCSYTKVGFSAEQKPRKCIKMSPEWIAAYSGNVVVKGNEITCSIVESDESTSEGITYKIGTIRGWSIKQWVFVLDELLRRIFFIELLVNPPSRRLVICESIFVPTSFRQALAYVLFNKLKVDSVHFLSSEASAVVPLEKTFGCVLVVDAGFRNTRILPMIHGIGDIAALTTSRIAGRALYDNLKCLIMKRGKICCVPGKHIKGGLSIGNLKPTQKYQMKETEEDSPSQSSLLPLKENWERIPAKSRVELWENRIEDILGRMCFAELEERKTYALTDDEEKDIDDVNPLSDTSFWDYPLSSKYILEIDGFTRTQAVELLFTDTEEEGVFSLPQAILECLLKSSRDVRYHLAQNIVLIGGTTCIPGVSVRLLSALEDLIYTPKYSELCGLTGQFNYCKTSFRPYFLSWIGAAVIGSVESDADITSENYESQGVRALPDWDLQ